MEAKNWKVIVVEDRYDDGQVIAKLLEYIGVEVYITKNGDECLQLLQEVDPALVITDLAMPRCDGWQTLVGIRSDARTAHIPVIAMTAYHTAEVAADALRAGFNGYLPKPIHPQDFLQYLRSFLT